ncbi:MAG: FeoB-associated Cys-rich membrane protein, partial [Anaerolineaceae bacterium]|nr:FeoB-associated Cys-rich membrane protein [Anaerolineaceae bacterium]
MNRLDILIILILAAAVIFAIRTIRKSKGGCSSCCSGDCS